MVLNFEAVIDWRKNFTMTKWGTEIPSLNSAYYTSTNWVLGDKKSSNWTAEENKLFEDALAHFDIDTPDRWERVAALLHGKSARDVMEHYQDLEDDVTHIEAGLIPIPGYNSSCSFTLDWENDNGFDEGLKQAYGGKRSGGRLSDQEKKKGISWTEEEHRLFLLGLKKYGKGDWRSISRNFVTSRTPTQVASHAQKYFIRLSSGCKDKRRSSIHDITTVNLPDSPPPSPPQSNSTVTQAVADSSNCDETARVFSSASSQLFVNPFMQTSYGYNPYEIKLEAQNSLRGSIHQSVVGQHNMLFQIQATQLHPHA